MDDYFFPLVVYVSVLFFRIDAKEFHDLFHTASHAGLIHDAGVIHTAIFVIFEVVNNIGGELQQDDDIEYEGK